jgi:hypothetical protein
VTTASAPKQSAVDALKAFVEEANARQFGPQWDTLVPSQQPFITRDRYIQCKQQTDPGLAIKFDKVVNSKDETVTIPGTSTQAPSTAITFQFTASKGSQNQSANSTAHEFLVNDQWHWSMSDNQATAYKAGRCT